MFSPSDARLTTTKAIGASSAVRPRDHGGRYQGPPPRNPTETHPGEESPHSNRPWRFSPLPESGNPGQAHRTDSYNQRRRAACQVVGQATAGAGSVARGPSSRDGGGSCV